MPDKWFGILDLFDHDKKVEKSKKEPAEKYVVVERCST